MRRAIVLGGYGLIGTACMRALADAGFAVPGIERSRRPALAADADAAWVIRDIAAMGVSALHRSTNSPVLCRPVARICWNHAHRAAARVAHLV